MNYRWFVCLIGWITIGQLQGQDLTLLGNTGLTVIPTAYFRADRTLSIGYTYVDGAEVRYNFNQQKGTAGSAARVVFANLTFLPFMEATIRLTRPYAGRETLGLGDRSLFLRFKILKEKKWMPALSIGFHDLISSPGAYFQSNYLVLSKRIDLQRTWGVEVTSGYGFKWSGANNGYLLGVFGGLRLDWKAWVLSMEYDAEQLNAGLKFRAFREHLFLQIGLLQLNHFSGGLHLRFRL